MTTMPPIDPLSRAGTGLSGEERANPTYDTGRAQIAGESRERTSA